jgi:monoamine oxidase
MKKKCLIVGSGLPGSSAAYLLANYVYINTDQAILQGIDAAKKAIKMTK